MSLKPAIDKIFKRFTNYFEPGQAVTQMASLGSLSGDLYQDSKRFVYELLQNADDAAIAGKKIKVFIGLFGEELVVAHTGRSFNDRDVRGIAGVADGTKKRDDDKTGYKGVGFKAVFGQSDKVTIYSNPEYFRFDAGYAHPWNSSWEGTQEEWETENDRPFVYPWPIIPIYTTPAEITPEVHRFLTEGQWQVATIIALKKLIQITTALNELAEKVDMYLFLKNIDEIIYHTAARKLIEIKEDDQHQTVIR